MGNVKISNWKLNPKKGDEKMNMNDFARSVTLQEGGKVNLSIGQVKEVIKLTLIRLAGLSKEEREKIIARYAKEYLG